MLFHSPAKDKTLKKYTTNFLSQQLIEKINSMTHFEIFPDEELTAGDLKKPFHSCKISDTDPVNGTDVPIAVTIDVVTKI